MEMSSLTAKASSTDAVPSSVNRACQYSREVVLAAYREGVPVPATLERHSEVFRESNASGDADAPPWKPMALVEHSEREAQILVAGKLNSELMTRRWNAGGNRSGDGRQQRGPRESGPREGGLRENGPRDGGRQQQPAGRAGLRIANDATAMVDNSSAMHGRAPLAGPDTTWSTVTRPLHTTTTALSSATAPPFMAIPGADQLLTLGRIGARPQKERSRFQFVEDVGANAAAPPSAPSVNPSVPSINPSAPSVNPWSSAGAAARPQQPLRPHQVAEMQPIAQPSLPKTAPTIVAAAVPPPRPLQSHVEPMWLYRDPHGAVQGPFKAQEMMQWYEGGYFAETLLVKQTTDEVFVELAVYMQRFGGSVQFNIARAHASASGLPGLRTQHMEQPPVVVARPDPRIGTFDAIFGRAPAPSATQSAGQHVHQPATMVSPPAPAWGANQLLARPVDPTIEQPSDAWSKHGVGEVLGQAPTVWNQIVPSHTDSTIKSTTSSVTEAEIPAAVESVHGKKKSKKATGAMSPAPAIDDIIENVDRMDVAADASMPLQPFGQRASWDKAAVVSSSTAKPSLREIQEAEEREQMRRLAEQKKHALENARLAAIEAEQRKEPTIALGWATASKRSTTKSLAEIQQEEELAAIKKQTVDASLNVTRRYAETVGSAAPTGKPISAWAAGKLSTTSSSFSTPPLVVKAQTPSSVSKVVAAKTAVAAPRSNIVEVQEKDSLTKWCTDQLRPVAGRIDVPSFLELLTPLTDRETISDVVYDAIGSYTDAIDAKGFLVDYLNRRSEGVALQGRIVHPSASSTAKPQPSGVDKGFVQVSKKKRSTKKTAAERAVGSAVGVGGRTVVGANH